MQFNSPVMSTLFDVVHFAGENDLSLIDDHHFLNVTIFYKLLLHQAALFVKFVDSTFSNLFNDSFWLTIV